MSTQTISWQAPEFRYYEKNAAWYVTFAVVDLLLIAFFIYQKDLFAAVTVGILGILVAFFAAQKPQTINIELNSRGIVLHNLHFPYKQMHYFWIVSNHNHKTLNFETNTVVKNTLVVQLMDQDENEIHGFLVQYLPEHHQTRETLAQRVSHHLRF